MERIKQAIEKVKQSSQDSANRPIDSARVAVPPAPTLDVGSISYERTRVVQLDRKHLEKHRIVALNKSDLNSLSFDLLRTQVLQKMDQNGLRTLAIVSPVPGCGKTVVAINLAMSIAHHTQKTAMLVDFDLRKPKIAEYLGIATHTSFNEVLEGKAQISDVMVNPGIPQLVVIPVGRSIKKSAETMASDKVKSIISEVRDRYKDRVVIFDLPPLLNVDDAIAVLPQIDCVLMVVGNGMVTKQEMEASLHLLRATDLLGVILNKAEIQQRRYY